MRVSLTSECRNQRTFGEPGGVSPRTSLKKSPGADATRLTCIHPRGVSLPIVLISISLSLMLTYATLNSQTRNIQVRQNVNRQELAHQAAESGVAVALNQLQSTSWAGVSTAIAGTLASDTFGTATYSVQFLTIDGQTSPSAYASASGLTNMNWSNDVFDSASSGLSTASVATAMTATKQAFQLLIRSTGKWQSASTSSDVVTDIIEAGVELQPRVPGRAVTPGESASATDVKANSASYDTIQTYALFATTGSSSNPSLTIEPGHRIDGPSWLSRGVAVFNGPKWSSGPRNDFLLSTGTLNSSTSGGQTVLKHPHPFGGSLTTNTALTTSEAADMTKLNVPRQQATSVPTAPTVTFSNWQTYQLFQGGFTYNAETLTSSNLDTIVLRPTPKNPLGIFYRSGSLTIGHSVVVQGTLVCTSKVQFTGNNSVISSINWRDSTGATLLSSSDLFPRLPAIVCQNLDFDASVIATVEGAILSTGTVTNSASDYDLIYTTDINLSGSQATCTPLRQPYSQVQLPTGTNLSNVLGGGQHAIWLTEGNSGNWFSIVDVDNTNKRLTVLGEAKRSSPVSFQIRRQRYESIDLRGPVMTTRMKLVIGNAWQLGTSFWNSRYSLWQLLVSNQQSQGQPQTPFVTWVGDPASYPGWGSPFDTVGLPLEPTFHVRPLTGMTYRESLPIFKSYVPPTNVTSTATTTDPSGYRWRVLFWRNP